MGLPFREGLRPLDANDRAKTLLHAVKADTSKPFIATDGYSIDNLEVLENLRTRAIKSIRKDLISLGERSFADAIISTRSEKTT